MAIANNKVAGLIAIAFSRSLHLDSPLGRITTLVVDSGSRRQGLGKSLVREVIAAAECEGCCGVEVTTNTARKDALGFYAQNGFQLTSNRLYKPLSVAPYRTGPRRTDRP